MPPLARTHLPIFAPPRGSRRGDLAHPPIGDRGSSDRARGAGVRSYTRGVDSPPERPVQLRNDLDALYVLVGELQITVRGIAATQQEHGVRLGALQTGQDELRTGQDELRTGQAELRTGQAELRSDVAALRSGQDDLRAGQDELRSDVAALQSGQAELRNDVTALRSGQDEILRLLRDRS